MQQRSQVNLAGFGVVLFGVLGGLMLMCGGKPIDMGAKKVSLAKKHAAFVAAQRNKPQEPSLLASLYDSLVGDARAQQPRVPTKHYGIENKRHTFGD